MHEWMPGKICTCSAPPDIDDTVSTFEEPLSLVSEVILYALGRRDKRLVNMDTLLRRKNQRVRMLAENYRGTTDHWATEWSLGKPPLVNGAPPDGVIENEDSLGTGVLLQDVLDLCIVH